VSGLALISEQVWQRSVRLALICSPVASKRIFASIGESLEFNLPTCHALRPQSERNFLLADFGQRCQRFRENFGQPRHPTRRPIFQSNQ